MRLSPAPIDRPSILVVDADWDTAASLSCLLRLFGHSVHAVHDGYEAIEAARRYRPRHVLLEIALPGLDGYRVAEGLRADAAGPMNLIAITGQSQQEERLRALASGFDRFFVKPIERDSLDELLAALDDDRCPHRTDVARPARRADGWAESGRPAEDGPIGWQASIRVLPLPEPPGDVRDRGGVATLAPRRRVEVTNAFGLHLRAADRFVRLAQRFRSEVRVICNGQRASGRSILDLATLAAAPGTWLELEADGPDAKEALDALGDLVRRGFDE